MIKDISKLSEKPFKFQKEFLQNCDVYEKIEAFYFRVKVLNQNTLKFYKSNNKEIDTVDIILNKMWETPINDFTKMFFSNEDFIQKSIGMTFSFFFFPVSDPLGMNYAPSGSRNYIPFRYILDTIKLSDGKVLKTGYISQFEEIDKEHLIRKKGIYLGNINISNKEIKDFIKDTDERKYTKLLIKEGSFTKEENLCMYKKHLVSGFILKYKEDVYQYQENPYKVLKTRDVVEDNRLALELFTHSFTEFLRQVDYMDFISSNNYIKSVCTLTLKYKNWLEKDDNQSIYKYYNITARDLTAPTFGYYPGPHIELIPNQKLRDICKGYDIFWNNVFKILLNGLRKEKKNTHPTLVMTENDIETWNTLVKLLLVNDTKVFRNLKTL